MQYYSTEDGKKNRLAGLIAGLAYLLLWAVLFFFVSFRFEVPTYGGGILVDFGDSESAAGSQDPALTRDIAAAATPSRPQAAPDELLTQDFEDAPVIQQQKPKPQQKPAETQPQPKPQAEPDPVPEEKPREVNRRALFPGRTVGSTSTSEGTGEGTGNQGAPQGEVGGSHEGTGSGIEGNSVSLAGRNLIGELPRPAYDVNEGGRVMITITVNGKGDVVNAVFRPAGSTTQNSRLVDAAIKAAQKARFSPSESQDIQTGTITYNFHLK